MLEREQLIEKAEALGIPELDRAKAFLDAEEAADLYVEYAHDATPTFAQAPGMSKLYMQAYTDLLPGQIEYGLTVRQVRAQGASKRTNVLYMTTKGLDMQELIADDSTAIPLKMPISLRLSQLAYLAMVAQQPHISLRLIPDAVPLPQFTNVSYMENVNGNGDVAFKEVNKGLSAPITEPAKLERYRTGLVHLSRTALSTEATLDAIRTVEARMLNYS